MPPDDVMAEAVSRATTTPKASADAESAVRRTLMARVQGIDAVVEEKIIDSIVERVWRSYPTNDPIKTRRWLAQVRSLALKAVLESECPEQHVVADIVERVEQIVRDHEQARAERNATAMEIASRDTARQIASDGQWAVLATDLGLGDVEEARALFNDDLRAARVEVDRIRRQREAFDVARAADRKRTVMAWGLSIGGAFLGGLAAKRSGQGLGVVIAAGAAAGVATGLVSWALSDRLLAAGPEIQEGLAIAAQLRRFAGGAL